MFTLRRGLALLGSIGLTSVAFSQVSFPETEPNGRKTESNPVVGIVAGDSITGLSTGTSTTAGNTANASADMFRVKTAALPLGIYKHSLTVTTSTATGHTGTIRGLSQVAGGIVSTSDVSVQTSSTAGLPPRTNWWYGFGKQEEIYYRVTGATASTATYTASMSTTPVVPVVVPGTFNAGPITITSVGQTTVDTEIYVYDASLNPLALFHNDDEGPTPGTLQSRLTRGFPPGTYFVAVSDLNTSNDQSDAVADESNADSSVLDFPNAVVSSDRETAPVDYDVTISDGGAPVAVSLAGGGEYDVAWATFTVVAGPPPAPPANDACASATPITTGAIGYLPAATNDGSSTCDGFGRDVWYAYTANFLGGTLSGNTCGFGTETTLTVFSSCGGSELACNDDCGGAPCGGPGSCFSGLVLAPNQTVFIRVGDKGLTGGNFQLSMNFVSNTPSNDDCNTPLVLPGAGAYPFDITSATTGTQGQGTTTGCFGAPFQDIWYTYTSGTTGSVTITTCNLIQSVDTDTILTVYSGAGCPPGLGIVCNDDDVNCLSINGVESTITVAVTCGQVLTIQLGAFFGPTSLYGTLSVSETGTSCSTPTTAFCLGDGTGAPCPCGNTGGTGRGCASASFASGARLSTSGVAGASAGTDTLVLTATDIPGPGLFFQSTGLAPTPVNFGDGLLCAAIGIIRLGVVFPTAGVASYPGGLTPNPIHIQGSTASGDLRHYQCWYRSVPGLCNPSNFDLTQGLSLTWVP